MMKGLPSLTTAAHELVVPRSMPMIGPVRGPAGRSGTVSSTIVGSASTDGAAVTGPSVGRGSGGGAGRRETGGSVFARSPVLVGVCGGGGAPVVCFALDGGGGGGRGAT